MTGRGGRYTRAATTGGGPAEIGTTETATTPDTDRTGIEGDTGGPDRGLVGANARDGSGH